MQNNFYQLLFFRTREEARVGRREEREIQRAMAQVDHVKLLSATRWMAKIICAKHLRWIERWKITRLEGSGQDVYMEKSRVGGLYRPKSALRCCGSKSVSEIRVSGRWNTILERVPIASFPNCPAYSKSVISDLDLRTSE